MIWLKGITMVDLSLSYPVKERANRNGLFAQLGEFFAIIGAAIRASRAVEAHRRPNAEDLAILGIKGQLPRTW